MLVPNSAQNSPYPPGAGGNGRGATRMAFNIGEPCPVVGLDRVELSHTVVRHVLQKKC